MTSSQHLHGTISHATPRDGMGAELLYANLRKAILATSTPPFASRNLTGQLCQAAYEVEDNILDPGISTGALLVLNAFDSPESALQVFTNFVGPAYEGQSATRTQVTDCRLLGCLAGPSADRFTEGSFGMVQLWPDLGVPVHLVYGEIARQILPDALSIPNGLGTHFAFETRSGRLLIADIWRTEEQMSRFADEQIMPATAEIFQKFGISPVQPDEIPVRALGISADETVHYISDN